MEAIHVYVHAEQAEPLERLDRKLDLILRRLQAMAENQADFDTALAAFITDIDAGVQVLVTKAQAAGVDLSAEATAISDAKARFDAAVASVEPAPAPAPAPEPAPAPAVADAPVDAAPPA